MVQKIKEQKLTRKDFVSDQEVRWCPGCGDYAILAQMQKILPTGTELHTEPRAEFRPKSCNLNINQCVF